ncbi:pyridoxamine 5'-phosphate oxidase family protein [Cryobacterium sp. TMT1-62]|uniref:Pyridoxamine 5'-phosphate oxidase family protein n=1 Tax=Cryobacterium sandaracinum TaxID=1259247 RepID=A0ABY2J6J0_9MICO|nr:MULTISPECIES: pyridoxamine 5'-phosphate oxidase family protein [Cryobacterium]TFB54589.1 pyridoxamine 5'-phosphate oxidase family protein [Cryobacterium sp. Sr3]TFB65602.1 pyridoxamine 5'-phosphate oxidase family protein [Cryobacterium sp. Hz7]TFC33651.1 pyridoxamine 5'-phosphate oxidase family protein [Cryobacterium sp. TMT2-14]TFC47696.1 pyridoxamine 5'-phosphate oxidase family protein [Cryobacterium sp. TMT2-17-1]TFC71043.1 pyridoxamine 5'-phosphate oxidase family protein [Cryobacterium 
METNDLYPVQNLSEDDCWDLLISSSFGRLAMSISGEPDIYPVNFVSADRRLVFRTAEGTKLLELTVNNRVAFEIDGIGRSEAWSVVARGEARVLDKQAEIEAADQLPLRPLIPTLKYIYVEITPTRITGRRFQLGPEPDRY